MRPIVGALASLLAGAALVAGCGNGGTSSSSSGSGQAKSGGTVTVGLAEDPDALDPTLARTFVGRIVFANMCEKLYDLDSGLNIVPQLAAALPAVSNGGKTVTIKLRTGIKFNDGTPFNAKAVKESLERHIHLSGSSRASELTPLKSVDAVGADKVVLHLSGPYAPLNAQLADRAGMVMSPKQLAKLGAKFGNDPVCVGPFQFVSRKEGDSITLKKAPDYYDASKVKIDKLVFRVIDEPSARAANLRSGDVQLSERLAATDVKSIQSDPNLTLKSVTSLGYQGVTVNVGNKNGLGKPMAPVGTPLSEHPELRQAFSAALDRDAISKVVYQGEVVPGCTPISPSSPFRDAAIPCPKPDVNKAKQLVAQSGVKTPIPVTMMLNTDAVTRRLGEAMQAMVKPAGFDLKLQPTEFTASLDKADAGQFDTFQIGWSGRVDPDGNLQQFVAKDGSQNEAGYSNPKVDSLLNQARTELNTDKRTELYKQANQILFDESPLIYLYFDKYNTGISKKLTGVQIYGDGLLRFKTAGLTG
jgi:peptide/nickel transport system substrate-binding protein